MFIVTYWPPAFQREDEGNLGMRLRVRYPLPPPFQMPAMQATILVT